MQPDANEAFLKLVREYLRAEDNFNRTTHAPTVPHTWNTMCDKRAALIKAVKQIQARRQQGTIAGHVSPDDYDSPIVR